MKIKFDTSTEDFSKSLSKADREILNDLHKKQQEFSDKLHSKLKALAMSALEREHDNELTNEQKSALCFFAGVRSNSTTVNGNFRIEYPPCGFQKLNGRWIVFTQSDAPAPTPIELCPQG